MKRISALLRLAILMSCSSISIPFASAQTTLYVDSSAAPGGNGNSWANAMTSLADAVLQADTSWSIDTILIAKGTYYPEYIVPATSATTDRDKSFYFLRDGLALIGGYPNGGGVRSLQYNPVILSGDIGIRGDSTDNAYHVMLIIGGSTDAGGMGGNGGIDSAGGTGGIGGNGGVDSTGGMGGNAGAGGGGIGGNGGIGGIGGNGGVDSMGGIDGNGGAGGTGGIGGAGGIESDSVITIIDSTLYFDGLTITGGNANGMASIAVNGIPVSQKFGAGIHNNNYASPAFANCIITGNNASLVGSNAGYGGGMYNDNHSGPSLVNCTFTGNKASWGGGIYNYDYSNPSLLNCIFSGNYAVTLGGGMVNSFNCSPAIVNSLFAGNAGASVSGMFNYNNSGPTLLNVTISGNKADADGSSMENAASSSPVITNSICYGNSSGITNDDAGSIPLITYSLIQGSVDTANGNIDENTNPLFVEPVSYTAAPTTDGDYRLRNSSPLINKGDNAAVPVGDTIDPDGYARITNDTVDLGAYEYKALACPGFSTIYVDSAAGISGDGSSWSNAMTSLANAIRLAQECTNIDTILIAKGTYFPAYKPLVDTPISSRDRSFCFFRGGLAVAGGYPSGGGSRNPQYNPVILSGDIGIRGDSTDNAYHVMLIIGDSAGTIDSTLYFDGLTVTGGNANGMVSTAVNGTLVSRRFGAGIHDNNYASPAFANCTITGNNASLVGSNAGYGGGMYNDNHSGPSLVNCTFTNNKASWGGGIYNYDYSAPTLLNCVLSGNYAAALGGGMVNSFNCSPAVVNCLFTGNAGTSVSGMFNYNSSGPTLLNVTISGNKADADGSSMENAASSSPVITNSICYGNSSGIANDDAGSVPIITHSLIQGSVDTANGNIAGSTNPFFTAPESYTSAPTTGGDYHLQNISLLINKGNNAIVPAGDTIDLAGNPRIVNDTVDIGAYEYLSNAPLPLGLLSFEAAPADDCKALVGWQTASEQKIAQFVVEQSADAVAYIAVASQIPANATEGKAYQLLIPMSSAVNYFRLKILAEDGSYTYSKVAGISSHCGANDIRVYPNPAQSTLYIKHSVQGMRYMVLDSKGDILMKGSLENNITAIPVTGLSQGTYLLRITTGNGTGGQAFKFIKL